MSLPARREAPPRRAIDDAIRAIPIEWFKASPAIYWADLLSSAALGWGALVLGVLGHGWLRVSALTVAALSLYHAALFIHEITHRATRDVPGFSFVWNALVGVPLLVPSFLYEHVHTDHHRQRTYGTAEDPEYMPFGRRSPLVLAAYVIASLCAPAIFAIRFAILAPLGWIVPRFGRFLSERCSALVINHQYVRRAPIDAGARAEEVGAFAVCWISALLWWKAVLLPAAFGCYAAVSAVASGINALRTLAAHRYDNESEELSMNEQLLDSCTIAPSTVSGRLGHRVATMGRLLIAPVGLRYHALHHWIPSLPYHNLGRAHRLLVGALAPDAPYGRTIEPGFTPVIHDLVLTLGRFAIQLIPRLKIGICAPYDLARSGGVNTVIRAQAGALRQIGHDVCVFGAASAPLPDGEVSLGGCLSIVIGETETGFGVDPRSWWTTKRLLREKRFDVVHMHEPLMPLPPWFVLWQAAGDDVPVIATFQTYREQGHRWYPKYKRIFDPLMARVDVRLAGSEAAKRTVAAHFPGDYGIMPNGIDVERFAAPAARPAAMPAGRRHVLYIGRIEPRKGVDRLVRAMANVQRHVPGVQLVIAGRGPDRQAIESLARELDVRAVFADRVSDDELPGFYQSADVVCSPALGDESFGLVLLEAMAAGRPIVASNIDGYAELLTPAGSARLAKVGDVNSLAEEIRAVLTDASLARTLGERGAAAAKGYDHIVIAKRLEEIYQRAGSVRL